MADRTPGPWKAVYCGCIDWDLDGPTTQEDWTLAAAAPDLLDALKQLLRATEGVSINDYSEEVHDIAVSRARAAIAKATGEQS
jgi:hypothetical protein